MEKPLGKKSGEITIDVHLNGLDEQLAKAYENLRIGIDSTERKYQKASERGRRNGAKGGRPRKGSGGCEQDVKTQE
ncbi:MAG TPA: hypothetical protein H9915_08925, partial [Candidatus Gemmiger faecigallinarum]|nr:hypothetical protein [Candidatus Gemmiger faecigallinarum]